MGQITFYLDDESEKRLRTAAKKAGIPVSRWVASLVQEKTGTGWPASVRKLAGAWRDFPDLETIRKNERNPKERDSDIANAEIALRRAAQRARERARRTGLKVPVYRDGQVVEEWPEEQDTSDVGRSRVAEQEILDLLDESTT